jgi:hypothetical protein
MVGSIGTARRRKRKPLSMTANYWKNLSRKYSRRRILATSVSGGLAAGLLVACGGSDEDDGPQDRSGLLTPREHQTDGAAPGGTWVWSVATTSSIAAGIDPHRSASAASFETVAHVYTTLLKYSLGTGERIESPDTISGAAAQSWETSPDGLQVTLKLRPDERFDARAPTNGRLMTSASGVGTAFRRYPSGPTRSSIRRARSGRSHPCRRRTIGR